MQEAEICKNRLVSLLATKASSKAIAEEFDVSRATVTRHCLKYGLKPPGHGDRVAWMKSVRSRVLEMQPLDAVNWLLDIVEAALPGQSADQLSKIRDYHPNLTATELKLLATMGSRPADYVWSVEALIEAIFLTAKSSAS